MTTPVTTLLRFGTAQLKFDNNQGVFNLHTPKDQWALEVRESLHHPKVKTLASQLDDRFVLTYESRFPKNDIIHINIRLPNEEGHEEGQIYDVTKWLNQPVPLWRKALKEALKIQDHLIQRGLVQPPLPPQKGDPTLELDGPPY